MIQKNTSVGGDKDVAQVAAKVKLEIRKGRWAENTDMRLPVTVVGFGLVVLVGIFLGRLRTRHLHEAGENVSIDASKEIILRYAIWYYGYPLLGFVLSAFCAYDALHNPDNHPREMIGWIAFLFCLGGAIFLLYRQLTARVRIADKKLIYTEGGDRREISADDVVRVSTNGFAFIVGLKYQKTVKIPATFEHSEIILAFLQRAAAKN